MKLKTNKNRNEFTDICVDINDVKVTKTYERFFPDLNDKILVHEGNIYYLDKRYIQKLFGEDVRKPYLKGFARIKRLFQQKRIGILNFEYSYEKDNLILPITRNDVVFNNEMIDKLDNKGERKIKVTDSPLLLKSIVLSDQFEKFIRTLPSKKGAPLNINKKWIIVILGVVGVVIVIAIVTGMIKLV